jgi:hypothetical protein
MADATLKCVLKHVLPRYLMSNLNLLAHFFAFSLNLFAFLVSIRTFIHSVDTLSAVVTFICARQIYYAVSPTALFHAHAVPSNSQGCHIVRAYIKLRFSHFDNTAALLSV